MANVLFIDDEQDVINHYMNVFPREEDQQTANLKSMASDFFNEPKVDDKKMEENPLKSVSALTALQGLDGVGIIQKHVNENNPIQVVFVDMRMPPGIDGYETAKRIRAIDKNVEIVIVTAYSDARPENFLKELGPADKIIYLRKPFDLSEIRQLILNLTSKYKMERIKEEFMGNVTHELKTPLASILGFSELLLDKVKDDQESLDYVKILHSNSKLMQTLISDLLLAFTTTKGKLSIKKEKVLLNQLLEETLASFQAVEKDHVELILQLPKTKCYADVDIQRMKQVLFNLIGNSLKFTQNGSVELKLEETKQDFVITVSDTGIGIPEDKLPYIFDKFYRVENEHHEKPGLGLGLSIVQEILNSHLFTYEVKSIIDKGTQFIIHLPKKDL